MKRFFVTAAVLATTAGCASLPGAVGDSARLSQATTLLREGKDAAARKALTPLASGASNGVADKALFHLALLYLKDEADYTRARQSLEKLQKDYPSSEWAPHASSLVSMIGDARQADDLRRQLRSLKEANYSLTRENKELRLNIDKLKSLDLELEKKIR